MKFAQQLRAMEKECAPQWRGKFIDYKQLKKLIKKCRNDAQGCPVDEVDANDARFFRQLETEVKAINRNFETAAKEVLAASKQKRINGHPVPAGCFSFLKKPKPMSEYSAAELAAASAWCRQYALINAAGLRKIAKKHDKYCGGSAGSRFLQACWDSGHLQWGSFLHSPLMDELKALEEQLHKQASKTVARSSRESLSPQLSPPGSAGNHLSDSPDSNMADAADAEPSNGSAATGASYGSQEAAGRDGAQGLLAELSPLLIDLDEEAMTCAICLEPMFLPLGLSCGHKTCAECALRSIDMHKMRGQLRVVLEMVSPHAPCPQCRQAGVFRNAILMNKLGAAIAERYPDEIGQRAKASGAKKQEWLRPQWFTNAQQLMLPFSYGI